MLGGDTEHAIHNMALLEKVALDYLLTLLAGEKAAAIPLPIREIAFDKLRADEKKLAAQEHEAALEVGGRRRRGVDRDDAASTADAAAAASTAPTEAGSAEAEAGVPAPSAEPAAGASAPPADQQYAISEYPDVAAVYAGLGTS